MSPKAAEPSTKTKQKQELLLCIVKPKFHNEFVFCGGGSNEFSNNSNKPSNEEILSVRRLARCNPDDLDSRELWVLEQSTEGDEDD